jgi:phage protein D
LANGAPVAGVVDVSVTSNNNFAADRFAVTIALSANDPMFWTATDSILLEIGMGVNGAEQPLIQGQVDTVEIDAIQQTLRVTGRDLAAALIAARTQESFQNQTASQIAQTIAARHGLAAAVTPTMTPVGRYYQIERDRVTLNSFNYATTEWDLLIFLARQEQFDLYVSGTTLHFEQPSAAAPIMMISPTDVLNLHLERALTLASGVSVTVKSWNSRQQKAFTETAARGSGHGQNIVVVRPNLQPSDAQTAAQSLLDEIAGHERFIMFSMPGELTLTARSRVLLSGTGTAFDQPYSVAEIERSLSLHQGFLQHVRAKGIA